MLSRIVFVALAMVSFIQVSEAQSRRMAVSGALGIFDQGVNRYQDGSRSGSSDVSGLLGIGGDFEMMYSRDLSFGGLLRYYNTSESYNGSETSVSITTFGGFIRGYYNADGWALYAGPGIGFVAPSVKSSGGENVSYGLNLGFYWAMGMLYHITPEFSLGVENLRMVAIGEKVNGSPINDYMFKGRFSF